MAIIRNMASMMTIKVYVQQRLSSDHEPIIRWRTIVTGDHVANGNTKARIQ